MKCQNDKNQLSSLKQGVEVIFYQPNYTMMKMTKIYYNQIMHFLLNKNQLQLY
ncbi:hypothetical protein pb186bvf_009227 [Paramecium bursaria]